MDNEVKSSLRSDVDKVMEILSEAMELLNNWRLSPPKRAAKPSARSEDGSEATPTIRARPVRPTEDEDGIPF